jgi:hypothetical protein
MTRLIGFAVAFAAAAVTVPATAQDMSQEPLPPGYASPTLRLPPRDASGDFTTPNRNLTGQDAFWNLRIALNVAAIGCRGQGSLQLIADYNNIISRHGNLIRAAEASVIGKIGVAARDRTSTKLFNYFAQPPAQREFCRVAGSLAQQMSRMDGATAMKMAPSMLAEADKPFVDFYHAYARYQVDLAAYRSGNRGTRLASARP